MNIGVLLIVNMESAKCDENGSKKKVQIFAYFNIKKWQKHKKKTLQTYGAKLYWNKL